MVPRGCSALCFTAHSHTAAGLRLPPRSWNLTGKFNTEVLWQLLLPSSLSFPPFPRRSRSWAHCPLVSAIYGQSEGSGCCIHVLFCSAGIRNEAAQGGSKGVVDVGIMLKSITTQVNCTGGGVSCTRTSQHRVQWLHQKPNLGLHWKTS